MVRRVYRHYPSMRTGKTRRVHHHGKGKKRHCSKQRRANCMSHQLRGKHCNGHCRQSFARASRHCARHC
ncbi:MAG: hypothetical protein EHM35_05540 [Planctomycetaceae bacterium]|nr:MAG: hypothetical protein EHM35_05540 [Planctomycetaceae bacterium]